VQFFIELGCVFHVTILLQPGETGVPHDLQQPGTRVSALKTIEETKGAEHRFLRGVLGVGAAAQEPPGEIKSGIKMR
jgi:hypothetical protein